MSIDHTTSQAIKHTLHCLLGCSIGEVLGMVIGGWLGWADLPRILLAVALAFFFGYLLTYMSVRKNTESKKQAIKITLATDTVSITSMEIVDNLAMLVIPGAMAAGITTLVFWLSLAIALAVAFVVTVPVNRFMIARNPHAHHHMH